eukprot:jgi/Chlat1/2479/Chrsp175S02423
MAHCGLAETSAPMADDTALSALLQQLSTLKREASDSPPPRNTYYVLRHGRSVPNEKGLIVSQMVSRKIVRVYPVCMMYI